MTGSIGVSSYTFDIFAAQPNLFSTEGHALEPSRILDEIFQLWLIRSTATVAPAAAG